MSEKGSRAYLSSLVLERVRCSLGDWWALSARPPRSHAGNSAGKQSFNRERQSVHPIETLLVNDTPVGHMASEDESNSLGSVSLRRTSRPSCLPTRTSACPRVRPPKSASALRGGRKLLPRESADGLKTPMPWCRTLPPLRRSEQASRQAHKQEQRCHGQLVLSPAGALMIRCPCTRALTQGGAALSQRRLRSPFQPWPVP